MKTNLPLSAKEKELLRSSMDLIIKFSNNPIFIKAVEKEGYALDFEAIQIMEKLLESSEN